MFEDSLMESTGQIKTKSRYWTFATAAFNLSILGTMILVPLLNPDAMPKTALAELLILPPPPPPPPPPPQAKIQPVKIVSEIDSGLHAPAKIPTDIRIVKDEAPPSTDGGGVVGMNQGAGSHGPAGANLFIALNTYTPVVQRKPTAPAGTVHVPSSIISGLAISKPEPVYPPIAKAAHVQGMVLLHATISKEGTIENLEVINGNGMLTNAAMDAVRRWRYRPYILDGVPVEVETSITVNFLLNGG